MAKEIKMPLPSAADLFSTQEERDNEGRESVREIPLEEISDFPNHPFKVKMWRWGRIFTGTSPVWTMR